MTASSSHQQELQLLYQAQEIAKRPGNTVCAECPERHPTYVSFIKPVVIRETLGVLVCEGCYKHHFRMGMHFCEVKSLHNDDLNFGWSRREVSILQKTGNEYVNSFYEAKLLELFWEDDKEIITFDKEEETKLRAAFIKNKYIRRKYFSIDKYQEEKDKRDEAQPTTIPPVQQEQKQRRHTTHHAPSTTATQQQQQQQQQQSSAMERNCKGQGQQQQQQATKDLIPATPRTMGRRRATLASTRTSTRQLLSNIPLKHSDLMDPEDLMMMEEEKKEEEEPESGVYVPPPPPARKLTLEEKSLSTRSLSRCGSSNSLSSLGERTNSTAPLRSLQQQQQQELSRKPQQQAGLAMFLALQDNPSSKDSKKKKKSKQQQQQQSAINMRRCMSVTGTNDTRQPNNNDDDEEPKPILYSDKVAMGTVEATEEVQRLKAAKLARKSRRARARRASMSHAPTTTTSTTKQRQRQQQPASPPPPPARQQRRTKSPSPERHDPKKQQKLEQQRDFSPSPTSIREETCMSHSLYEYGTCDIPPQQHDDHHYYRYQDQHEHEHEPAPEPELPILTQQSHSERRQAMLSCSSSRHHRRRGSLSGRGGGEDPLRNSNHSVNGTNRRRRGSLGTGAGVVDHHLRDDTGVDHGCTTRRRRGSLRGDHLRDSTNDGGGHHSTRRRGSLSGRGGSDPLRDSNHSVNGTRRLQRDSSRSRSSSVDPLRTSNHRTRRSARDDPLSLSEHSRPIRRNHQSNQSCNSNHQQLLQEREQERRSLNKQGSVKSLLTIGSDHGRSNSSRRCTDSSVGGVSRRSGDHGKSKSRRTSRTMSDGSDPGRKKGSRSKKSKKKGSSSSKRRLEEEKPDFQWDIYWPGESAVEATTTASPPKQELESKQQEQEEGVGDGKYKSLDDCRLRTHGVCPSGSSSGHHDASVGKGGEEGRLLRESQSAGSLRLLAMMNETTTKNAATAFSGLTKSPSAQVMIGATRRRASCLGSSGGSMKNDEFTTSRNLRGEPSKRSISLLARKEKPYENHLLAQWQTGCWPAEEEEDLEEEQEEAKKAEQEEASTASASSSNKKTSKRSSTSRRGKARSSSRCSTDIKQ